MAPPWRTIAVAEVANYFSDLGVCCQKYKSSVGAILNRIANDIRDGKVDEAYASFLQDYIRGWESQFVEEEKEEEEEEEEDDDDPTYMTFLENLKECGNGYMLGVSIKHGVSFPIKYEVEDDPPDELERKIQRRGCSLIRERRSLDLDNKVHSCQKDSGCLTRKRTRSDLNDEPNSGTRNSSLAKENLPRRSPRISEDSLKLQGSEVNLNVSSDLKSDFHSEDTLSHILARKREKSVVGDSKRNISLKNASSFGKKCNMRRSSVVVENSLDAKKKNPDCKAHAVDQKYGIFMAGLRVDGDSFYYESPDGKRVYYLDDDHELQRSGSTPRPPTPPLKKPTLPPRVLTTPPTAQTVKHKSHMLSSKPKKVVENSKADPGGYSWFWKALEKDLRRPFAQNEYEDLLENVKARKPISIHRETRSGGYATELSSALGNSYLDSFPDLKSEIKKVKSDSRKVLNLLRGFFFYLKKVPHGVPKPWKDEYCKTIMPSYNHDTF